MTIVYQAVYGIFELKGACEEMKSNQMDFIKIVHLECPITYLDFNLM